MGPEKNLVRGFDGQQGVWTEVSDGDGLVGVDVVDPEDVGGDREQRVLVHVDQRRVERPALQTHAHSLSKPDTVMFLEC
eukprot:225033-Rhodomonas_salina.4